MRFLDLFTRKSTQELGISKAVKKVCEFVRPPLGSRYSDSRSTAQYRSWVYVAASHNADAVSSSELSMFAYEKTKLSPSSKVQNKQIKHLKNFSQKRLKEIEEILEHPVLDLLDKPNDIDTAKSFIQKIDLFLELTGDCYVLVGRDSRGIPNRLDVLYSQFMSIQTDGVGQIAYYNYGVPVNGKYQFQFTPEEIIHIKFFDPNNQYYGISPLQACFRSVGLIDAMDTYEESLNRNQGVPSGVLKYNSARIKKEDKELIESKWQQKFASVGRAGKTVVTDQDVTYESLGINPREMNFIDGRKWSREEILACYRLPIAMLLTEGVNRSNMIQAETNYYKWTIRPRQQLIAQALTKGLLKGTLAEGKAFFAFDDETPSDADLMMQKAKILATGEAITKNELRLMMDFTEMEGLDELVSIKRDTNLQSQPQE